MARKASRIPLHILFTSISFTFFLSPSTFPLLPLYVAIACFCYCCCRCCEMSKQNEKVSRVRKERKIIFVHVWMINLRENNFKGERKNFWLKMVYKASNKLCYQLTQKVFPHRQRNFHCFTHSSESDLFSTPKTAISRNLNKNAADYLAFRSRRRQRVHYK